MSITKSKQNGKWVAKGTVYLQDGTRRHYNRSFDLKREAAAWEQKRREELQAESPSMTLDAFVQIKDEKDKMRLKANTIKNRKSRYTKHIQSMFGSMPLAKITPAAVDRWYTGLTGKGLEIASANQVMMTLSAYMSEAVRMDLIPANPCSKVKKISRDPNTIEDDSRENFWTPEEFEAAMRCCPEKYVLPMQLLWRTGMRIGEASGLQWRHVHDGRIEIRQQYSDTTHAVITPKTGKSVRVITIDSTLQRMLAERRAEMEQIEGFSDDWYVMRDYRCMTRASFADALMHICAKSGVKRITPHGLRHSHASILINAGINDSLIADRMGHTVDMLHKIYSHIYDSKRLELADEIEKLLA